MFAVGGPTANTLATHVLTYTHTQQHTYYMINTHTHTTHTQLCSWDEQNALLVESHARVIGELTEDYEVI